MKTVWTTKYGDKISIKKMTDAHLMNTIHYLQRISCVWKCLKLEAIKRNLWRDFYE